MRMGVVKIDNMKAELIYRMKDVTPGGEIMEMVIWKVPEPVPPCSHGFKYRLVYIVEHRRVVGFDNERGKGDHKHIGEIEHSYRFESLDQLIEDFIAAVSDWRAENEANTDDYS